MGREDGAKWTAAADSQPTLFKSDRLLAEDGNPSFATVAKLAHALGFKLSLAPLVH